MGQLSKTENIGVSEVALQLASQSWCQEETSNKTMDEQMAIGVAKIIDPLIDHLCYAWTIIANAGGGNWAKEHPDWVIAAIRWRDKYHNILNAKLPQTEQNNKKEENV